MLRNTASTVQHCSRTIIISLLCAALPCVAAGEDTRVVLDAFVAKASPALDYARKNDSGDRTVTIDETAATSRFKANPRIELEHRLFKNIAIEAHISHVDADADALAKRTVRFLFFPVRLGLRIPVQIANDRARLRIGWVSADPLWDGSGLFAGAEVVQLSAAYTLPGGERHRDSGLALLPSFGTTLRYKVASDLTARFRGSYAPGQGKDVTGDIAEVDVGLEWRFGNQMLAGLGYRNYRFRLEMLRKDYNATASFVAKGPLAYIGYTF
jgi:hypothetical protein